MKIYREMRLNIENDSKGRAYAKNLCDALRTGKVPYRRKDDTGYITITIDMGGSER